jgi:two-component system, sensor histidine kinase PdtaS
MQLRRKYVFLLTFIFSLKATTISAQINKNDFVKKFNACSQASKLRLLADLPTNDLHEIIPLTQDSLEKLKKTSKNSTSKFLLDYIESGIQFYNQNYQNVIYVLENSIKYNAIGAKDSLYCLIRLKSAHIRVDNINAAFEINKTLDRLWLRIPNLKPVHYGEANSQLYFNIGLYSEAIKHRRTEYLFFKHFSDTDVVCNFYNDMGCHFKNLKMVDSAEKCFANALKFLTTRRVSKAKENEHRFFVGLVKGNLGDAYAKSGKYLKAIPLIKTDIFYSIQAGQFESAFNAYISISTCFDRLKQYRMAQLFLDSAQTILQKNKLSIKRMLSFLLAKADNCKNLNDHLAAASYYQKFVQIQDSITTIEKEKVILNKEASYNISQKEKELNEKDKALEEQKLEEARQKTFKAYLLAGVLVLLAVVVFLILNNRYTKRREEELFIKNQQINAQNHLIEQSLKEKEVLIKEIHHRVKNNLQIITSMLSLQMGKTEEEKTISILNDAKQRINSIALTHQMLYQNESLSNINLGEYITNLVNQIQSNLTSHYIEIESVIESKQKKVNIDNAIPLGLIINEIITNAYKHAFPKETAGIITVNLIEKDESFILKISDNGVGLQQKHPSIDKKSMGIELIEILADQLDANMQITSSGGTTYQLEINLKQK